MSRAAAGHRTNPRRALGRSITLMRVFLASSAVILVVGGVALSWVLSRTLERQALVDARTSLTQYVGGVLSPQLLDGGRLRVSGSLPGTVASQLRQQPELRVVKVWRADGVLAWTNLAPERIGRRFDLDGDLGETIRERRATASFDDLGSDEDHAEAGLHLRHVLEVYAPIASADGRHVLGAYEIYASPHHLESFIASRKHVVWISVAAVFAALYAALALLVRGASATLTRQADALRARSRDLLDAYGRLEERSLEAIETLNATVDARDPYTAGHSARVQRIALAVADELGVAQTRLPVIRYGSLFHDIGKIGVPDAILGKEGPLTPAEYDVIKRHPADGADIVAKLGSLRDAVPLIRHHHERWDGFGYPDGLRAEEIPTEACVVGLADAWDAMTSDRPYRAALGIAEAASQVRAGRGTQFSPTVVDAFFRALRRQPAVFEPPHVEVDAASAG